jgi:hypothetical protein
MSATAEEDRVPFETGDLLIAATDVDDSNIDLRRLRGAGRILHVDHDFRPKNTLWTGQTGLVVGIGLDPTSHRLFTADPHNQNIVAFDARGGLEGAVSGLPRRPFGSVVHLGGRRFLLGVHSARGPVPEDEWGAAKLFLWDASAGEVRGFEPEIDGGATGWHCVTGLSVAADGRTVYYVSERGRRIARFDIESCEQGPDFLVFAEGDPRRTYGVGCLADGRVVLATGNGASLMSPEGETLREYACRFDKGWTRISLPSADADYFYLNNFLEGVLERRSIETGDVLADHDIQRKCSLCGVQEVL